MANTKQAKFIIDVSAEKKRVTESSVRFFSYDSKTAEIIIQAEKEEQLISKSIVSNVEIFFESVDASFQPTDKLKWKDQMTVVADGLFSYLLPDELLNYQGLVAFEIYINYTNNDKSDSSYRIVYAQRSSAIDRAAGEIELVYIKDFEALKKEVALAAAETIASITEFYSGLDTYSEEKKDEMDAFSTSVGTLASAEKLKIQAELPKVQQTSTSETTKIKAEYPIIEQVATTEKEKIRAVLSTVDQTASEISAYADRKISEYDAKFTQSNQKMNDLQQSQTALTTKLTETQQKITDSDVFTKAESSVNVIDNIAGTEKAILKNGLLIDGISGTGARDDNGTLIPFVQDDYYKLASTDTYVRNETLVSGRGAEIQFDFNVIETLESRYPAIFESSTTIAEKISKYKTIIKNVNANIIIRGRGIHSSTNVATNFSRLFLSWGTNYSNNTSLGIASSSDFSKINSNLSVLGINSISNKGYYTLFAVTRRTGASDNGAVSDGVTPAWVEVKDISLTVELEVNGRTIIESMIAAYCRPLEQQINDLAQKVAAMENK